MSNYPVMFTFRDVVSGNGFLSGVTLGGRALIIPEDGSWSIYGVRPAPIAESGKTPLEAFANFRNAYKNVLFDLAEDAESFEEFKQKAEQFYSAPDPEEEGRWTEAFKAIRTGNVKIEESINNLPKEAPENRPAFISVLPVREMSRCTAADNVPDKLEFAAAA